MSLPISILLRSLDEFLACKFCDTGKASNGRRPAVKTGDTAAYQDANARWYANAHDIAVFLSQTLDPPLGTLADMDKMMKDHLDHTTAEVVARHNGDWTADVAAYEKVHAQVLEMADMLSDAIIANFPDRFRP